MFEGCRLAIFASASSVHLEINGRNIHLHDTIHNDNVTEARWVLVEESRDEPNRLRHTTAPD